MKNNILNLSTDNRVPNNGKSANAPTIVVKNVSLKNKDAGQEQGAKNFKDQAQNKDAKIVVTTCLQQGIKRKQGKAWFNDRKQLERLRVRVVLCTNQNYATSVMDFMSQRYNEYQSGMANLGNKNNINGFMENLAGASDFMTIKSAYPEGPFDTEFLTKKIKTSTKPTVSYREQDMAGVFVYDESLLNLTLKNNSNKTKIEAIGGKIQVDSGEGKFVSLNKLEIPLKNIEFNIGTLSKNEDLEHISCYAFTYLDNEVFLEQNNLMPAAGKSITTPLETGMGFINIATPVGARKIYEPQQPTLPIPSKEAFVLEEQPDVSIFADMRGVDHLKKLEIFDLLSNNFYDSLIAPGIGNSSPNFFSKDMAGSLRYRNYFSNLWISRDKEDNISYLFSFDKQSFLRENSVYSQLYLNDQIAQVLMNGAIDYPMQDTSKILDIKLVRRQVHRDREVPWNDLGTSAKKKPLENKESSKEKIIGTPELTNVSVENDFVDFYTGIDIFDEERNRQTSSIYQYGVTFYLQDSAPLYLMNISSRLQADIRNLNGLYEHIINSNSKKLSIAPIIGAGILYDPETNSRKVSLKNITIYGSDAHTLVRRAISHYIDRIALFSPDIDNKERLVSDLINFASDTDMENLFRVIDLLTEFRAKIEQILEVQFPNGYHDDRSSENDMLKRKGFCQRKYIINEVTHYFDQLYDLRESYKTGYCFVSPRKSSEYALGSMTVGDLQSRAHEEFKKYFSPMGASEISQDDLFDSPLYNEALLCHFSPETIYVNGRPTINQLMFKSQDSNQTEYDLDTYGRLFSDFIALKNNKNRLLEVTDQGNSISPDNRLFENLAHALVSKDCQISSQDLSIKDFFSTPKPKRVSDEATAKKDKQKQLAKNSSLDVLPFMIGGINDESAGTNQYYSTLKDKILEQGFDDELKNDPTSDRQGLREGMEPIKLAFSILGQMEINLPSMTEEAAKLNLTSQNIKEILETKLATIPNQIKSMLIVATDMTGQEFEGGLEAVRNLSFDPVDGEEAELVSTTMPNESYPPYVPSLDPMLIYSKLTAFWMNYRHLCVVEYLSGFDKGKNTTFKGNYTKGVSSQNKTFSTIRKNESWKKLTPGAASDLAGKNVLCRVRIANEKENIALSADAHPSRQIQFSHQELFSLPLYDQYFILRG